MTNAITTQNKSKTSRSLEAQKRVEKQQTQEQVPE